MASKKKLTTQFENFKNQCKDFVSEEGWICPKCGAVMAPWKPNCINCTGNEITITQIDPMLNFKLNQKVISQILNKGEETNGQNEM